MQPESEGAGWRCQRSMNDEYDFTSAWFNMFSADIAFHAAALIHLDYCLVDQRSPFQKKRIPCKWSWQLWPIAFLSFTSSLLLLFSSWVHYHYYPSTFFPFIWLCYFLSSSQPFSQNPPTATPELPHPCSMFSVLPVPLVSHRTGNWQQIVPQLRVRWLQGVSQSLFC